MLPSKFVIALAAVSALLLTGCVPNRPWRSGSLSVQTAPVVAGTTTPANFKLGIVEFDDMGESWEKCTSLTDPNNCQLTRTLDLIRQEKQGGREVVVVVFTHGWKNNASPYNEENGNLRDFKLLMARLSAGEPARLGRMQLRAQAAAVRSPGIAALSAPPARPRSYIGIYMAWRGQVIPHDLLLSFWNRRDAAQRVGSSDFAEAIYRIMAATKQDSPNSRIVVVGHSFGARALEGALTNTFVSLLVPQPDAAGVSHPLDILSPADLILYVNSANESFRTKQMIELMKRTSFHIERGLSPPEIAPPTPDSPRNLTANSFYQGPLFLSITSTGDTATGIAFPLGQDLSATRKSFRHAYDNAPHDMPSQKTFFTHTPGHIPFLFSHQVQAVPRQPCASDANLFRFDLSGQCYQLTPKPARWNDSPFWVVPVPTSIIKNHSDIFNANFSTMIIDLIEHYQVLDSPAPTTRVRIR